MVGKSAKNVACVSDSVCVCVSLYIFISWVVSNDILLTNDLIEFIVTG